MGSRRGSEASVTGTDDSGRFDWSKVRGVAPGAQLSEANAIKRRLDIRYELIDPSWRANVRWWIESSVTGRMFELSHSMLSIASCVMYVIWTYYIEVPEWEYHPIFNMTEIVFVLIFLVDYLLRVVGFGMRYMFSLNGIVDLVTTVPTLIPLMADFELLSATFDLDSEVAADPSNEQQFLFLRFLRLNVRILRALRFLRVLRTLRFLRFTLTNIERNQNVGVQRQITEIVLTALTIIFCTASMIQILDVDDQGSHLLNWHDAFYLTITTISTVGYGDIAPIRVEARLVMCFVILLSLVLIPRQTSRLINMSSDPPVIGKLPGSDRSHLVLTGNGVMSHATVSQFLRALYANDTARTRRQLPHVVLLHPSALPRELRNLIQQRLFLDRVSFFRGSTLVEDDMLRARVRFAEAVFVLGDPGCDDATREDAASLMMVLAVRSFSHDVPCLVQLLSGNSIGDLNLALDPSWPRVHAVNIVELKNLILAKACVVEGYCTFITNLLVPPDASAGSPLAAQEERSHGGRALTTDFLDALGEHQDAPDTDFEQYERCASNRLMLAAVPEAMHGMQIQTVSLWLRLDLGSTLIAVKSADNSRTIDVVINPSVEYTLTDGDILYIVSTDEEAPKRVMRLQTAAAREDVEDALEGRVDGMRARVWPHIQRLKRRRVSSVDEDKSPWKAIFDAKRLVRRPSPQQRGAGFTVRVPFPTTMPSFGAVSWGGGGGRESGSTAEDGGSGRRARAGRWPGRLTTEAHPRGGPGGAPEPSFNAWEARWEADGLREMLHWKAEQKEAPVIESVEPAEVASWENHVILSVDGGTLDWGGVAILAGALRVSTSSTRLLVLTYDAPEPQEWTLVQRASKTVHWMRGSFAAKGHLARANVRSAHRLMILVPPVSQRASSKSNDLHLVDQQAVLTYLSLDAALGSVKNPCIVELEYLENVRFLRPDKARQTSEPPPRANGLTRRAEIITDTLTRRHSVAPGEGRRGADAQYSSEKKRSATAESRASAFHPAFASGRVFSMRSLDALLNHAYLEPSIVELVKRLSLPCPDTVFSTRASIPQRRQKSHLTLLPVPPDLAGRTFGTLYQRALVVHGIVCLALVTRSRSVTGAPLPHTLPFVITNPPLERSLSKHDYVYVLTVSESPADLE